MQGLSCTKTAGEDLAAEIGQLMDAVRQEITALLLDGVQRSASYCASLCAERIIAARRQVHRQFADAENMQRPTVKPLGRKAKAAARAPRAPLVRIPTPSPERSHGHRQARSPGAAPKQRASQSPGPAPKQKSPQPPAGTWEPVPAASSVSLRQPMFPRRATSQGPSLLESWIVSAETSDDEHAPAPVSTPSPSYDAVFIDTYDAVSALEERTAMAMEAMDRLDDVLKTQPSAASEGGRAGPDRREGPASPKPERPASPTSPKGSGTPVFGSRVVTQFPGISSPSRPSRSGVPVASHVQPPPFGLPSRIIGPDGREASAAAAGRGSGITAHRPPAATMRGLR